jgi:hypothetical protein
VHKNLERTVAKGMVQVLQTINILSAVRLKPYIGIFFAVWPKIFVTVSAKCSG